jgi:hypothetical protein
VNAIKNWRAWICGGEACRHFLELAPELTIWTTSAKTLSERVKNRHELTEPTRLAKQDADSSFIYHARQANANQSSKIVRRTTVEVTLHDLSPMCTSTVSIASTSSIDLLRRVVLQSHG